MNFVCVFLFTAGLILVGLATVFIVLGCKMKKFGWFFVAGIWIVFAFIFIISAMDIVNYEIDKQWDCCGETIKSDYCTICGQIKPEKEIENNKWTCCDNNYDGNDNFCADCGKTSPFTEETTSNNKIIIEKDGTTAIYEYDDYQTTN